MTFLESSEQGLVGGRRKGELHRIGQLSLYAPQGAGVPLRSSVRLIADVPPSYPRGLPPVFRYRPHVRLRPDTALETIKNSCTHDNCAKKMTIKAMAIYLHRDIYT